MEETNQMTGGKNNHHNKKQEEEKTNAHKITLLNLSYSCLSLQYMCNVHISKTIHRPQPSAWLKCMSPDSDVDFWSRSILSCNQSFLQHLQTYMTVRDLISNLRTVLSNWSLTLLLTLYGQPVQYTDPIQILTLSCYSDPDPGLHIIKRGQKYSSSVSKVVIFYTKQKEEMRVTSNNSGRKTFQVDWLTSKWQRHSSLWLTRYCCVSSCTGTWTKRRCPPHELVDQSVIRPAPCFSTCPVLVPPQPYKIINRLFLPPFHILLIRILYTA